MCMQVYMQAYRGLQRPEMGSDPLELEWQAGVGFLMWVLGTKVGSTVRAADTLLLLIFLKSESLTGLDSLNRLGPLTGKPQGSALQRWDYRHAPPHLAFQINLTLKLQSTPYLKKSSKFPLAPGSSSVNQPKVFKGLRCTEPDPWCTSCLILCKGEMKKATVRIKPC